MTQYTKNSGNTYSFLVEYADPAGAFSGSFLHVLPTTAPPDDPSYSDYNVGSAKFPALADSVNARLTAMFGVGRVTWTAKEVQSVTPAVIDVDF